MKIVTALSRTLVRATGLIQVVLGLLLWIGIERDLVAIHVVVGFVLVFGLWTLAVAAARSGVGAGLVVVALLWGLLVPLAGLVQDRVLPGDIHPAVQLLHLLVGLGAIGVAEVVVDAIERRPSPWSGWSPRGPV